MKRKYILELFFLLFVLMLCAGCKSSPKKEKEIKDDLNYAGDFYANIIRDSDSQIFDFEHQPLDKGVFVDSIEIIKRQTDKKNRKDWIWVMVWASNDDLTCELAYKLDYELYNSGWLLEGMEPWKTEKWSIKPNHGIDVDGKYLLSYVDENSARLIESSFDEKKEQCRIVFELEKTFLYGLVDVEEYIFDFDEKNAMWNVVHYERDSEWAMGLIERRNLDKIYLELRDLEGNQVVSSDNLIKAEPLKITNVLGEEEYVISFLLDEEGTLAFEEATERAFKDNHAPIRIYLDGTPVAAPRVSSIIYDGVFQLSPGLDNSLAEDLASKIILKNQ